MSSKAREIVVSRDHQSGELFAANKMDELAEMFAPDAKFMVPGIPIIVGRQAIKAHLQGLRQLYSSYGGEHIQEEVLEFGDDQIVWRGKLVTEQNGQMVDATKYIDYIKKIDGKWFTEIAIFNSDQ